MIFQFEKVDKSYKGGKVLNPTTIKNQPRETWDHPGKSAGCSSCGTVRQMDCFPKLPCETADLYRTDDSGYKRSIICEFCMNDWYRFFIKKYGGEQAAIHRICMIHGIPYRADLVKTVLNEQHEYNDGTIVSNTMPRYLLYFKAVEADKKLSKSLCIDEELVEESASITTEESKKKIEDAILTPAVKKDRDEIIQKFHYDPFDKEATEDRGRLYSDLLTLYDDAMATDLVRQRAAIEIVKSFHRIDKIGQTIQELQSDPRTMMNNSKMLKELVDQKSKETKMVTDFSKDHGFAERYQMAKSKGAGSLSSIVRDGFENNFDKLAVNRFDIETSNAMQQVADISAQAMFNQIQLTGEDFRQMIEDQRAEIETLQKLVSGLQEANRILREKQIKEELIDEYLKDLETKGITDPEVIDGVKNDLSHPTYYRKDGEDS